MMTDVVARAREALATRRAQESPFWPHQLVVDLVDALEQARADLELPEPVGGEWCIEDVGDVALGDANGVRITNVGHDLSVTRSEARSFAAALLAAANAAELSRHPDCPQEKP